MKPPFFLLFTQFWAKNRSIFWVEQFLIQIFVLLKFFEVPAPPPPPPPPFQNPAYAAELTSLQTHLKWMMRLSMTPPKMEPIMGKARVTFLPTLSPHTVMIIVAKLEGRRTAMLVRRLNLKPSSACQCACHLNGTSNFIFHAVPFGIHMN